MEAYNKVKGVSWNLITQTHDKCYLYTDVYIMDKKISFNYGWHSNAFFAE